MKAVVLAGGKGERMYPVSHTQAKEMIRFCGKPLISYHLDELKEAGIKEIILVINPEKKEEIESYFKKSYNGMKVNIVVQEEPFGPADAIYQTKKFFSKGDYMVVKYGDSFSDIPALKLLIENFKKSKGCDAFITLKKVEDVTRYGIVKFDSKKNIIDIVEKPKSEKEAPSNMAFMGCFILNSDLFFKAFEEVGEDDIEAREETHCMKYIFQNSKKVGSWIFDGKSIDVGRPWNILEANELFLKKNKRKIDSTAKIHESAMIIGNVHIGKNTVVYENAVIKGPCWIGDNCIIGTNTLLRNSTHVDNGAVVGSYCELKNAFLMQDTEIGHFSYIGDSVIGRKCKIGARFISANRRLDRKTIKMIIQGQLKDTGLDFFGCVMGDNVALGVGVVTNPGRLIGPNCVIGPGVVLYKNIPKDTVVGLVQNLDFREVEKNDKDNSF
ncbi:MAG: sugar phosphate nucleotidyltransferase [Candidatus Nanoarchaeia archaeon]|nr:sugar phosphate nucleotidyltransferase [Candidatus Nanoarchaeia archaeon]